MAMRREKMKRRKRIKKIKKALVPNQNMKEKSKTLSCKA